MTIAEDELFSFPYAKRDCPSRAKRHGWTNVSYSSLVGRPYEATPKGIATAYGATVNISGEPLPKPQP